MIVTIPVPAAGRDPEGRRPRGRRDHRDRLRRQEDPGLPPQGRLEEQPQEPQVRVAGRQPIQEGNHQ